MIEQFIARFADVLDPGDVKWLREQPDAETALVEACHERLQAVAQAIAPEAREAYEAIELAAWEAIDLAAWEGYKAIVRLARLSILLPAFVRALEEA